MSGAHPKMTCTFSLEGGKEVPCTPALIDTQLRRLRGGGSPTYVILRRVDGSFLQVGGNATGTMVEWRDGDGRLSRAHQRTPVVMFDEEVELEVGDGRIRLRAGEWFRVDQAIELARAFAAGQDFPSYALWRSLDG